MRIASGLGRAVAMACALVVAGTVAAEAADEPDKLI